MNDKSAATVPSFDALMWPTINALKAMGGSASNEELLTKVIEIQAIPEKVTSFMHSGNRQTKLGYNLAWAKTYLRRAGAIENSSRGVWAITELGERMSEADARRIPAAVRKQDSERRRTKDRENKKETIVLAAEDLEEDWKDTNCSLNSAR